MKRYIKDRRMIRGMCNDTRVWGAVWYTGIGRIRFFYKKVGAAAGEMLAAAPAFWGEAAVSEGVCLWDERRMNRT